MRPLIWSLLAASVLLCGWLGLSLAYHQQLAKGLPASLAVDSQGHLVEVIEQPWRALQVIAW